MISLCHAHWQHAFFFLDCVCTLSRFSCECWTYFYRQKVLACLKSDEHTHIRCASVCVSVYAYMCVWVCAMFVCVCILLNQFVFCAWRDLQFPSELLPHSPTDLIVRVEAEGLGEGKAEGSERTAAENASVLAVHANQLSICSCLCTLRDDGFTVNKQLLREF